MVDLEIIIDTAGESFERRSVEEKVESTVKKTGENIALCYNI